MSAVSGLAAAYARLLTGPLAFGAGKYEARFFPTGSIRLLGIRLAAKGWRVGVPATVVVVSGS